MPCPNNLEYSGMIAAPTIFVAVVPSLASVRQVEKITTSTGPRRQAKDDDRSANRQGLRNRLGHKADVEDEYSRFTSALGGVRPAEA